MAIKRYLLEESEVEKKRARMEEDRLSDLPDDLKISILSFLNLKHAVQTSILLKSWDSFWTSIPVLDFNFIAYGQLPGFQDFVNNVLRLRDQTAKLQRLSLTGNIGMCDREFITNFLDYAFKHSIEDLEVEIGQIYNYNTWPVHLDDCCESLTNLKLQSDCKMSCPFLGPKSGLKNLRVLYLQKALITDHEPFLGFPMLEKLTLVNCHISTEGETLSVHARNLSHLTISYFRNLKCCKLTTPKLKFFEYKGSGISQLKIYEGLPVLETIIGLDFHPYGKVHELVKCSSPFQNLENSVLYFNGDPETFRIA